MGCVMCTMSTEGVQYVIRTHAWHGTRTIFPCFSNLNLYTRSHLFFPPPPPPPPLLSVCAPCRCDVLKLQSREKVLAEEVSSCRSQNQELNDGLALSAGETRKAKEETWALEQTRFETAVGAQKDRHARAEVEKKLEASEASLRSAMDHVGRLKVEALASKATDTQMAEARRVEGLLVAANEAREDLETRLGEARGECDELRGESQASRRDVARLRVMVQTLQRDNAAAKGEVEAMKEGHGKDIESFEGAAKERGRVR